MTPRKFAIIILSLTWVLGGCSPADKDTDRSDTGPIDTGWPEANLEVQIMSFEITETGIELSLTTTGWASNVRFNAYNIGVIDPPMNGWDEEHSPPATAHTTQFDPEGVTETRSLSLEHVASIMYWTTNETTLFNTDDDGDLTYAIRLYDGEAALAQCLVWGEDVSALYSGTYSKVNITSAPEEFTTTNCALWTE
jgi:hypothetical protein